MRATVLGWTPCSLANSRVASPTGFYLPQSIDPRTNKAFSPKSTSVSIDAQLPGNSLVRFSFGALQDDLTALNHLLRRTVSAHPLFQYLPLGVFQLDALW